MALDNIAWSGRTKGLPLLLEHHGALVRQDKVVVSALDDTLARGDTFGIKTGSQVGRNTLERQRQQIHSQSSYAKKGVYTLDILLSCSQ